MMLIILGNLGIISRRSDNTNNAFPVNSTGYVNGNNNVNNTNAVRPDLYSSSSIRLRFYD